MGVDFDGIGICTNSHADFFIRNLVVCKGDPRLAQMNGAVSAAVRLDPGSPAPAEPITLAQAKAHLNLRHDEIDDQVEEWIRTARLKVEEDTGLVLVPSAYRVTIYAFPLYGQPLKLPIWPVTAIDAVSYYDREGVSQSVGSPLPYLLSESRPAFVALETGAQWPSDLRTFEPGVLELSAGYATPEAVPDDLKQAIKVLVEHMMTHRGHVTTVSISPTGINYDDWIKPWILPSV